MDELSPRQHAAGERDADGRLVHRGIVHHVAGSPERRAAVAAVPAEYRALVAAHLRRFHPRWQKARRAKDEFQRMRREGVG